MSALKRILPRTRRIAKPRGHDDHQEVEEGHDCEKSASLQRKLVLQIKETDRAREDSNEWMKRYHNEHERLQKAEGLLSLRDAEILKRDRQLARAKARILKLEKTLFETGNEKNNPIVPPPGPDAGKERSNRRGKQFGAKGFGRKKHEKLPVGDEISHVVPEGDRLCEDCGEIAKPVGFEESTEVEVEVKAYKRVHKRQKVGHFCRCKKHWVTKTAAPPAKLVPKSGYAIGFWIFCLLGKFVFHTPVNRLCTQLAMNGLNVSQGTICGGFKRIEILLEPLMSEIKRYSREEKHHWHIDDTGWKVFAEFEGKTGHQWYMWVFLSDDVCVYILSPTRGRAVPKSHLENSVGVVTSDRLEANKKLGENVRNSYCWVHIRRELKELAAAYPEIATECNYLLIQIGSLYFNNKQRLLADENTPEKATAEENLADSLNKIKSACEQQISNLKAHPELLRISTGMLKDWDGLELFFEIPAVPLDNNPAERALRGRAVARNNYHGSSSDWSGKLAAAMFTLNETLKLNNVSSDAFLREYLQACALNGGHAPPNAKDYLPWNRHLLLLETTESKS